MDKENSLGLMENGMKENGIKEQKKEMVQNKKLYQGFWQGLNG